LLEVQAVDVSSSAAAVKIAGMVFNSFFMKMPP
jgi:hypothetical protein